MQSLYEGAAEVVFSVFFEDYQTAELVIAIAIARARLASAIESGNGNGDGDVRAADGADRSLRRDEAQ